MRSLAVFALTAAAGAVSCGPPPERPDNRPNILLVVADDIGYSDIAPYGGEIETPNLDRLARDGVRFTRYFTSNMCLPTRASLLTGVYSNIALAGDTLRRDAVTAAELLRQSRYQTYMAGKWHLAPRGGRDGWPLQRGFDHFYGTLPGAGSYYAPASLMRDNEDASADPARPDYYYTDAISTAAEGYIRDAARSARPFFLYVAYTAAHWPLHAPESAVARYAGRYAEGWDRLRERRHERMKQLGVVRPEWPLSPRHPAVPAWEREKNKEWQQRRMEVYAAQIEIMDQGIGRLLLALEQTGRLANTLILFQSDNGGCHVEYSPDRKGDYLPERTRDGRPLRPGNLASIMPGPEDTYQSYGHGWANLSNTPFRLFKQYDHQGGIQSPLIAHWPARIKTPGRIVDEVAHVIDVTPTLLDAAGVDHPARFSGQPVLLMDGKSLLPVLEGERRRAHDALFWKWAHGRAVRRDRWKLAAVDQGPWELYDIEEDGTELNDLAAKHPEVVRQLEILWQTWDSRKAEDRRKR
jgi:arylsulfatase